MASRKCGVCNGKKVLKCSACDGSGYNKVGPARDWPVCHQCTKGWVNCRSCGGAGWIDD